MSKAFTTRQANGINAFFEEVGVPEDQRNVSRLKLANATIGQSACGVCGHAPIKYIFHLTDSENGGDLHVGSECIETYMAANGDLVAQVKSTKKQLVDQAKKAKRQAEKEEQEERRRIARVAQEWIRTRAGQKGLLEHPSVVKVLEMLDRLVENNWYITEKQQQWAHNVAEWIREQ